VYLKFFFDFSLIFLFSLLEIGLTNSNVAITKAIISDITKPGEIRTLGYAYQV
jgi:hypothetical protein